MPRTMRLFAITGTLLALGQLWGGVQAVETRTPTSSVTVEECIEVEPGVRECEDGRHCVLTNGVWICYDR
jgi:hypothetical protein